MALLLHVGWQRSQNCYSRRRGLAQGSSTTGNLLIGNDGVPRRRSGRIPTVRLTDIVVNAQPSIENASPLPSALFAVPYSQQLSAADGTLPFYWDISTGSLPAGLSFSPTGTLAGTPMQAGTFNFTVRITDASSSVDSKLYQLTVVPGNSESIRISGATFVSGKTSLK
jgi:hypothetical protein